MITIMRMGLVSTGVRRVETSIVALIVLLVMLFDYNSCRRLVGISIFPACFNLNEGTSSLNFTTDRVAPGYFDTEVTWNKKTTKNAVAFAKVGLQVTLNTSALESERSIKFISLTGEPDFEIFIVSVASTLL